MMYKTSLILVFCFAWLSTSAQYEIDTLYCGDQSRDDCIQALAKVTVFYSLLDTMLSKKQKRKMGKLTVMQDISDGEKKLVSISGYYKGSGGGFVDINFSKGTGVINSFGIGGYEKRKKLAMSFDSSGRVVSMGKTKRVVFAVNCGFYKHPSYKVKRYLWNTGARFGKWNYWYYEDGGEHTTKVVKRYRRNRYWSILSVNETGVQLDKQSFYFKPRCDPGPKF